MRWHRALLENDDEDSKNVKKNKEAVSKDMIDFIENGEEGNSDKGDKNGLVGAPREIRLLATKLKSRHTKRW